ncbi:ASCH domain-containing protein [Inquilinus limosus]|uniref:ASCH domain-containing protein n=1 Tax=Inquilinus limosus TaxID=171674 RepID=A0A211ZFV9_9PROT|nr:ASCH domain-containing protein [Inquilinus limosus]OWJ64054.1 hypothetical protein BWR60_26710 [Inquilinus limosus]
MTDIAERWWQALRRDRPDLALPEQYDLWYFGDSEDLARELLELVLAGTKTATAGLVWGADEAGTPKPGGYSLITDFDGTPRCVLQTMEVRVLPFDRVDAAFAHDEGEDDRSLASWREAHWSYFGRRCAELGREPTLDMPVFCERFRLVYPQPRG